MRLPDWVGANNEDIVEIRLSPENVMLVLFSSNPLKPSVAAVLSTRDLEEASANSEALSRWLQSSQILSPDTTFRIFGNAAIFEILMKSLRPFRLKEGKHVALNEKNVSILHFLPKEGRLRAQKKTKVLVVDDSETICKLLSKIINSDPEMECVATVESPSLVEAAIEKHRPDVITLDIHMPEMNGVALLKKILPKYLIPTVMISALSKEDGTYVLDALEAGAVDYIQKPSLPEARSLAPVICEKLKHAKLAKIHAPAKPKERSFASILPLNAQDIDYSCLIAIGSSTGGTEALKEVLTQLPEKIPPIVIVQHIPPVFSKAFADRMNQLCPFQVKEAEDGDMIEPNKVLIAPGGKQMKILQIKESLKISIDDSGPVNRHKPSVDYLFDSIAALKRKNVVAAILTGMGADGAKGLLKLKQNGAATLVQDEATCVVFGMPKEALRLGGAEKAVPISQIAAQILDGCKFQRKRNIA